MDAMPQLKKVVRKRRFSSKKARQAPPDPIPEGVPVPDTQHAIDELLRARQMRNFYQTEANKLHGMWELTKKETAQIDAMVAQREEQKAALRERHTIELETYKEKVRHLLYEHKIFMAKVVEEKAALAAAADKDTTPSATPTQTPPAASGAGGTGSTVGQRAVAFLQGRVGYVDPQEIAGGAAGGDVDRGSGAAPRPPDDAGGDGDVVAAGEAADEDKAMLDELTAVYADRARRVRAVHALYDGRVKALREEIAARKKLDVDDVERRGAARVEDTSAHHERAFHEIREYYNNLTAANVANVRNLRQSVAAMNKRERQQERVMQQLAAENERLTVPLAEGIREIAALRETMAAHTEVQTDLTATEASLHAREQSIVALAAEMKVLADRYAAAREETDVMSAQYDAMMTALEKRAARKTVSLHRQVEALQTRIDTRGVDAEAGPAGGKGRPTADVEARLDAMLAKKNDLVESMQVALSSMVQQNDDVVTYYEEYLRQWGVPGLVGRG